jgi:hypothetical protein
MATFWTYSNKIQQYAEEGAESVHIPWSNTDVNRVSSNDNNSITTNGNLFHIARSPKHDILSKTYYIVFTNFKFQNLPETISGIELKLSSNRKGRITDDTISLYKNSIIGENKAISEVLPNKIYGDSTDLWGANLTKSDILDENFGVILRFKSHPRWPHNDPMFINAVELRIH